MATRKKAVVEVEVIKAPTVPLTPKEIATKMREKFIVAATEVANDAVAGQVAESIIADLNAQKREVTLKLLGLDDRWGKWDVDHCNGRNSPITQYLAAGAEKAIKEWVNEAVVEVLTEERKRDIKSTAKAALKREIDTIVEQQTKGYCMKERAETIINALLERAANEVRDELGLNLKAGVGEDD
jgi:hypothetical protein